MTNESDRFHRNPENVRHVELSHQPPGREHVRVRVEYARGETRVFAVDKSLLTTLLEELYAMESET